MINNNNNPLLKQTLSFTAWVLILTTVLGDQTGGCTEEAGREVSTVQCPAQVVSRSPGLSGPATLEMKLLGLQ